MENTAKTQDMTCEEELHINFLTQELLSKSQLLLKDMEELLNWCKSAGFPDESQLKMIQQETEATIEEDGETLVIDGFRFESAASSAALRKLSA